MTDLGITINDSTELSENMYTIDKNGLLKKVIFTLVGFFCGGGGMYFFYFIQSLNEKKVILFANITPITFD